MLKNSFLFFFSPIYLTAAHPATARKWGECKKENENKIELSSVYAYTDDIKAHAYAYICESVKTDDSFIHSVVKHRRK